MTNISSTYVFLLQICRAHFRSCNSRLLPWRGCSVTPCLHLCSSKTPLQEKINKTIRSISKYTLKIWDPAQRNFGAFVCCLGFCIFPWSEVGECQQMSTNASLSTDRFSRAINYLIWSGDVHCAANLTYFFFDFSLCEKDCQGFCFHKIKLSM